MDDAALDAFAAWERENWEVRAAPYAASLGDLTRGSVDALLDAAGVTAGSRVLDVGTGPGFAALAARDRGADVTAVDQAAAMVALARAAGLAAQQAPVERLPFDDGAFDAVVANYVLNHLARPEVGVAEMARVCRGRLALTVWDLPERNVALGLFGEAASAAGVAAAGVPAGPSPARFADRTAMTALLEGAGLDRVTVEGVAWSVDVEPARWFDAVAEATPRTGAVIAGLGPRDRARVLAEYELLVASRASGAGRVRLPAAAVLGSGVSRRRTAR